MIDHSSCPICLRPKTYKLCDICLEKDIVWQFDKMIERIYKLEEQRELAIKFLKTGRLMN